MGSSSKAGKGKKKEINDHALTLRRRLHEALSLGIREIDNKGRKWQCTDVEIQSHALRAMSAFVNYMPSVPLQHSFVKESVSDMLVALEGILRSENERILCLATDLTVNLVCGLGRSICQYHMLDIVISLSCALSTCQVSIAVPCTTALNRILTNLGAMSSQKSEELCKAMVKANTICSILCAMQDHVDGSKPIEYFTETASLLKTILWRYHFYALCGNGAMTILESNGLLSKIVQCLGTSQPDSIRLEALKLCQQLTRSPEGCSLLTSLYCEQIVQGIICAMGAWRSCSNNIPTDQIPLVMEASRTALITRWAGNHHSFFWTLEIDNVLLDNLVGNCSGKYLTQAMFLSDELITKVYDNVTSIRPYLWDILGWLATYCNEDFLPKTKGGLSCLDALIFCACAVVKDFTLKKLSLDVSEAEPVSRALFLMVTSPSKYIASKTRSCLFEMARPHGDGVLKNLLVSLKLIATGDVPLVSDGLQTALAIIGLACYSTLPQFQKIIVKKRGLQVISDIVGRCLNSEIHVSRSSIVSHLHSSSEGKGCCWNHVADWEGRDILLFYSLQALSQLIRFSSLECDHNQLASEEIVVSDAHGLISSLQCILNNNSSPGLKSYAAYILSFFGFFGIRSKLGRRMERALNENELADFQFILSNGQSLRVHSAILLARCPYLLPPKETFLKNRILHNGSPSEQETEQDSRKSRHEVRISDRVDQRSLIKLLEYIYTGFFLVEGDLQKPLKVLANCCNLKSLLHMLQRKLPTWGSFYPSCDFTRSLESTENSFFDIILEATGSEGAWACTRCQLSVPHVHAHKIILWANCDYLRALFQSGMHESYSQVIKVPVGWNALVKLVTYFYSGELPRIKIDCRWMNMDAKQKLMELQAYVELSSLAEFWLLEEVGNESLVIVLSCLEADQRSSADIIHFASELGQWKIVEAAASSIAHLYPKMRDAGELEKLSEEVVDMLRTQYVRYSQAQL